MPSLTDKTGCGYAGALIDPVEASHVDGVDDLDLPYLQYLPLDKRCKTRHDHFHRPNIEELPCLDAAESALSLWRMLA